MNEDQKRDLLNLNRIADTMHSFSEFKAEFDALFEAFEGYLYSKLRDEEDQE